MDFTELVIGSRGSLCYVHCMFLSLNSDTFRVTFHYLSMFKTQLTVTRSLQEAYIQTSLFVAAKF